MTDFAAEWLRLRERADARARSALVRGAVQGWAASVKRSAQEPLRIVDLACGTGNMLRYLAPLLPQPQSWTLVDRDAALLAAAATQIVAREAVEVGHHRIDLTREGLPSVIERAELVTVSALLDLVSQAWLGDLVTAVACPGRGLLAVLTYDGWFALEPREPLDDHIRSLVNQHQLGDKGFGPALGSGATRALSRRVEASGGMALIDHSDWALARRDAAMIEALLTGWAEAATAMAPQEDGVIAIWLQRRQAQNAAGALQIQVGHLDLFAVW